MKFLSCCGVEVIVWVCIDIMLCFFYYMKSFGYIKMENFSMSFVMLW